LFPVYLQGANGILLSEKLTLLLSLLV
jgi:hypothetical protein